MLDSLTRQARDNHAAYLEKYREELESENTGRTALMHDGEVIHIFNNETDAYNIGCRDYGLGNFSIELIGAQPAQLGIMAALME